MKYRTKTTISIRTDSIIAVQPVKKNECMISLTTGEKIQIAEPFKIVQAKVFNEYPYRDTRAFKDYVRFKSREEGERNV